MTTRSTWGKINCIVLAAWFTLLISISGTWIGTSWLRWWARNRLTYFINNCVIIVLLDSNQNFAEVQGNVPWTWNLDHLQIISRPINSKLLFTQNCTRIAMCCVLCTVGHDVTLPYVSCRRVHKKLSPMVAVTCYTSKKIGGAFVYTISIRYLAFVHPLSVNSTQFWP